MRRDLPNPRMPSLSQQLFVLPPSAKLIAGSFMILLALGAMLMMPGSFYSWLLLLVAGAIGPMLVYQGTTELRERAIVDEEMARAEFELDDLKQLVADLTGSKRGVERFLMERGYTSHKVRRWIALECDIVLPKSTLL